MIIDKLLDRTRNSKVCLGLDTRYSYLPEVLKNTGANPAEDILEFNKRIIDNTYDLVACYKVQIACYEALGLEGLKAYSRTLQEIRKKGGIVIADVKRGDISSTQEEYARAHFTGDFEADFMTVNPYMGEDAISPFRDYLKDKGIFVLLHTSNPSAEDFEETELSDGRRLVDKVADRIDDWGSDFLSESGYSSIGSVVGLTNPESLRRLREEHPHQFFLIPGYGAQGGTTEGLSEVLRDGVIINNSRAILTAHQNKTDGLDFINYIRDATRKMRDELNGIG